RREVDAEDLVPEREVDLLELAPGHQGAGVVDQDVQAAQELDGLADDAGRLGLVPQIRFDDQRALTGRFGLLGERARGGVALEAVQADVRARVDQPLGDGGADALRCSRDEGSLAFQISHESGLITSSTPWSSTSPSWRSAPRPARRWLAASGSRPR